MFTYLLCVPCLISLLVSVDVKHSVNLLTSLCLTEV